MSRRTALPLLFLLLLTAIAPLATEAQIKLIAHTSATNQSNGTAAIDTTGASMIAVCEAGYYGAVPPTDSAGNSYTLVAGIPNPGYWATWLYISLNPTTSPNEKWTVNKGTYPAAVEVFSGVTGFDTATAANAYPLSLTINPSRQNELLLGCQTPQAPGVSPLTMIDSTGGGSGISAAYAVQSSSSPAVIKFQPANGPTAGLVASFYSMLNPAPLKTMTKALPEAFVGSPYHFQMAATGGVGPYKWSAIGPLHGLSMSPNGLISGRPAEVNSVTLPFTVTDAQGNTASTQPFSLVTAASPPAIQTKSCPPGKQYQPYAGCAIQATGGTPPLTYTWAGQTPWTGHAPPANGDYAALVEGLNESPTGIISGMVKGQGIYTTLFIATDAAGASVTAPITFSIAGENSMDGCSYPADSIYYQNVAQLPVDTSPAAPIYSAYLGSRIRIGFGQYGNSPLGIPFYKVPVNQPIVPVFTGLSTIPGNKAPIPFDVPMEGTRNGTGEAPPIDHYTGDNHVSVLQTDAGANHCKEFSLYNIYPNYPNVNGAWGSGVSRSTGDAGNGGYSDFYADMTRYDLLPQGQPGADAAGLPIIPLLENYDEVLGTGTPGHENGVIREMKRFTLVHTLRGYVWPATHQAGVGGCTGGFQDRTGNGLISQLAPPACGDSMTGPMGEIYRLKAGVPTPACAATSPQSRVIIQGFRDHGIILADNGLSGAVIGTPDSRWSMNDLECLGQLRLSDFEPVKVQQLAVRWPTSSQVVRGSASASPAEAPEPHAPDTGSATTAQTAATVVQP